MLRLWSTTISAEAPARLSSRSMSSGRFSRSGPEDHLAARVDGAIAEATASRRRFPVGHGGPLLASTMVYPLPLEPTGERGGDTHYPAEPEPDPAHL